LNGELTPERRAEMELSPFARCLDISIKKESIPKCIASFLVDRVNTDTGDLKLGEKREKQIKLKDVFEVVLCLEDKGQTLPIDVQKTSAWQTDKQTLPLEIPYLHSYC
jgi:hypothetical protein